MINNLLQQAMLHLEREKFIDPFSDYGFKRIFGTESSKDVLMEFLNSLIPEARIKDLTFLNVEQNGPMKGAQKATYDILCKTDDDEYIPPMRKEEKSSNEPIIVVGIVTVIIIAAIFIFGLR